MSIRNKMLKIKQKSHAQNFHIRCWKMTTDQALSLCNEIGWGREAYQDILRGHASFMKIPIKIINCGF